MVCFRPSWRAPQGLDLILTKSLTNTTSLASNMIPQGQWRNRPEVSNLPLGTWLITEKTESKSRSGSVLRPPSGPEAFHSPERTLQEPLWVQNEKGPLCPGVSAWPLIPPVGNSELSRSMLIWAPWEGFFFIDLLSLSLARGLEDKRLKSSSSEVPDSKAKEEKMGQDNCWQECGFARKIIRHLPNA